MSIISDVFIQFFAAYLFGVLDAWNKKVCFFAILAIVVGLVIYGSLGNSIASGSLLETLWRLGVTIIGWWCGRISFNSVFKAEVKNEN